MQDWQRVEPSTVQKIGFRTIATKTFIQPDGQTKEFTMVGKEGDGAVGVLALTSDQQVIISRQFRPNFEMVLDEIPGGIIDPGEDPETAARRELREETGYEPGELKYLGHVSYDAYSNVKRYYYVATNCKLVGKQELDDGEFIEVVTVPFATFLASVQTGKMTDAGVIALALDELRALGISV